MGVQSGTFLPSGTTIQTPAATTVKISANNNQQEILPNTQHSIRITSKLEIHKTIQGQVIHYVYNKPAGYVYKASGNKIYAKPPGTVFSVGVNGDNTTFETMEGQIVTVEKVKVKVGQTSQNNVSKKNRDMTTSITSTFNAGQSKTFSGEMQEKYFNTYDEALYEIQSQLQQNQNANFKDDEQIADDYMLLGELQLDKGDANTAITYFNSALDIYYDLEYDLLSLAEVHLLVGEAYYMNENYQGAYVEADNAIGILNDELSYYQLEYQFASEDNDSYLMEEIAFDLFETYDFLGWAHELIGNMESADYYYSQADQYGGY